MLLLRVYAYTVTPRRDTAEGERSPAAGGVVQLTPTLREVIINAFAKIDKSALTTVDFDLGANREHELRDDLMKIAFGPTQAPKSAAERVAARLSAVMDNRSHPGLLVLSVEEEEATRRVSMLLLPREDVVQLKGNRDEEVLLNLLRDVFSTGSGLRKVARVEGHNSKTQFLSAEILDFQLAAQNKSVADFWVKDFLRAKLKISSESGTRLLTDALQRAFTVASEDNREAVVAAILRARAGNVRKTSLAKYAEELPNELQDAFLRGVSEELQSVTFEINRNVVKEKLGRRIFETQDGVVIYAPTEAVGDVVRVETDGQTRTVRYAGVISNERMIGRGRSSRTKATGD